MIIYKITNKKNGKLYIGQSVRDLSIRWKEHLSEAKGSRYNFPLYRAIRKYGEDNFELDILQKCSSLEELNEFEEYWIKFYKSNVIGYNADTGGLNSIPNEHSRKKMSLSQSKAKKGNKNPFFGKKLSKEHRDKISESLRGKKHPWYGKHHTEDTKQKLSQQRLGKSLSEEHKKNIGLGLVGKMIGSKNPMSKLSEKQVIEIRKRYILENISIKNLGLEYNVSFHAIQSILNKQTWKHVEELQEEAFEFLKKKGRGKCQK